MTSNPWLTVNCVSLGQLSLCFSFSIYGTRIKIVIYRTRTSCYDGVTGTFCFKNPELWGHVQNNSFQIFYNRKHKANEGTYSLPNCLASFRAASTEREHLDRIQQIRWVKKSESEIQKGQGGYHFMICGVEHQRERRASERESSGDLQRIPLKF